MNIEFEKQMGRNIRHIREEKGMTQELLSAKLQLAGCDITRSAVAKIEVGQIAIYNAFIPVLGVVLSCLLLGEPFSWRYLLSGALVTVGICAVNLPGKGKN